MNLANKITLARMALIPLFMLCFIPMPSWIQELSEFIRFLEQHGLVIGVIIFVIAAGTDKLDGYVARKI
ncbi:CDP-alcohol phosphatidyltransferase family protein [Paenibacillus sp. UMB7766-LJ446]|uniref:CDP-alcohol phosphatidyltransferase family protein n=1 Tax=Paenibacillus sp. UMB7766-LJ446 TaxID=3046313 RepID=UPI0033130186